MIAQRRTILDVESAQAVLDICWLGEDAAVIAQVEMIEENND